MVDYININLWGRQIGAAVWNERTGFATFEYAPEFVAHSTARRCDRGCAG